MLQDTHTKQQELRKELGLRNLVLSQILNIVGLYWIGVAAKLGPANVSFWLMGIFLFYLPSAAVVIYLNRVHTLEGGLYEWSRLGFNEFFGFLVAWNMWLNASSFSPSEESRPLSCFPTFWVRGPPGSLTADGFSAA
jgi:amino acid transporter